MQGMNRVTLVGALGSDPELKQTQGGQAILKFRLATSESFVDKSGQKHQRTEWHSCTLFGSRAEGLSRYLSKGTKLWLEGKLQIRSWDDPQGGSKRYATDVVCHQVGLLGGGDRQQAPVEEDNIPF